MKTPSLRRIVAIYFDDAMSSTVDGGAIEAFVKQWLRSPKMKQAALRLSGQLEMLASNASQVWGYTYTNPPSIRRQWMSSLVRMIEHYLPFFERIGLFQNVRIHRTLLREIAVMTRPGADPDQSTTMELVKDHLNTTLESPHHLYRAVSLFEEKYTEMVNDARELGWGDQLIQMMNQFKSPLGNLYTQWMRPAGLEAIGKHMPGRTWSIKEPGMSPSGTTVSAFLHGFASNYSSDMSAWAEVADAILNVAKALSQAIAWTPFVPGGPLPELVADLTYLCFCQEELIKLFPQNAPTIQWIEGVVKDAVRTLNPLHNEGGPAPRSFQQGKLANRAYAGLDKALQELDRRSLYFGGMTKRMAERAQEELMGTELTTFMNALRSQVDVREVTDIFEGIEDRIPSVLAQNPGALN